MAQTKPSDEWFRQAEDEEELAVGAGRWTLNRAATAGKSGASEEKTSDVVLILLALTDRLTRIERELDAQSERLRVLTENYLKLSSGQQTLPLSGMHPVSSFILHHTTKDDPVLLQRLLASNVISGETKGLYESDPLQELKHRLFRDHVPDPSIEIVKRKLAEMQETLEAIAQHKGARQDTP